VFLLARDGTSEPDQLSLRCTLNNLKRSLTDILSLLSTEINARSLQQAYIHAGLSMLEQTTSYQISASEQDPNVLLLLFVRLATMRDLRSLLTQRPELTAT
jgi:hypothetical protein